MSSSTKGLPADRLLSMMADQQRRAVLRVLLERSDEAMSVDELVATLTDEESRSPDDQQETAKKTTISLYHVHLPKLAEAGLVEFDQQSDTVRYRATDTVETVLRFVSETLEQR